MLNNAAVTELEDVCRDIGAQVAGDEGFVRIDDLLTKFHSEIIFRPLLVEGMIAQVDSGDSTRGKRWAVLIDSDTFPMSGAQIANESHEAPLPVRLRNTIAHELAHSLAFRPSDFGMKFKVALKDAKSRNDFVRAVEVVTERLSPLLLWPDKSAKHVFSQYEGGISADAAVALISRMGVSRPLFVQRLAAFSARDPLGVLNSRSLRNIAFGIGEWGRDGGALLRSWPLFWNFDKGIVPSFLYDLRKKDRLPGSMVCGDLDFGFLGGPKTVTKMRTHAGTVKTPMADEMDVELSFEVDQRNSGSEFLFCIKKIAGASDMSKVQ